MPTKIMNPNTLWLEVWRHALPNMAQSLLKQHIPVSYILDLHPNTEKIQTIQARLLKQLTLLDNDQMKWAPFGNLYDNAVVFWYNHAISVGIQEVPKPNKNVVIDEQHISKSDVEAALWVNQPKTLDHNKKN